MDLNLNEENLPVYEALASTVRLKILRLLCKKKMNVKELASEIGVSSSIMTMHIRKLETAGLIKTEFTPGKSGQQKISAIAVNKIEILLYSNELSSFKMHKSECPVGHYTNYEVEPTCGLATDTEFIGYVDDARYFMDPRRMNARILWFTKGFVEYKTPNFLIEREHPELIEISFEISSEYPFTNDNWPSDISFYLNEQYLGYWTSPGDFGDKRGKYTPEWWPQDINQYGLLKKLLITHHGTYMDGDLISNKTIADVDIYRDIFTFRMEVQDGADHVGGLTLFGKGFGNYDQDIEIKVYYSEPEQSAGN